MAITRRQFLKRAGVAAAGTMAMPSIFGSPMLRNAYADTIGDRYLVILYTDGGNDGLNTIIPRNDPAGLRSAYEVFRNTGAGGLRINEDEMAIPSVVPVSDPISGTLLGFHPGLAPLGAMYDAGNVAVIQGVGYPNYDLSHATSQTIWQTGNPAGLAGIAGSGWAGRHLALEYMPLDIYGVTIDNTVSGELRTTGTSVLAINRLRRFGFPLDDYDENDETFYTNAFQDLSNEAAASAQPLVSLVGNSGASTYQATQSYPALEKLYDDARPGFDAAYSALSSGTARDLREVAKCIYGVSTGQPNVNSRFFQVRNGGYDTHADQGAATGAHFELHDEVASAVDLFFQDMNDMGVGDKVTMVIYSEFSRRIPQNDNGTDHGSQGPMFVIGEAVNGGIYGNHPNINPAALDEQENTVYSQDALDPFRSTDFRDVFGTILKQWVNVPEPQILSSILPLDAGPAADYWTIQDFDLGFL
jgi:uncharacterized protein (DUF1501 family)